MSYVVPWEGYCCNDGKREIVVPAGIRHFSNRMWQYREALIDVLGVNMVQYPHYMLFIEPLL